MSRSAKLDDLSKDTPNIPMSFLDCFSDKLLAIITPKEVTELYEAQRVITQGFLYLLLLTSHRSQS